VLRLWAERAGLRSIGGPALRPRPALGEERVPGLCAAAGERSGLWDTAGGETSSDGKQPMTQAGLRLVSGELGEASPGRGGSGGQQRARGLRCGREGAGLWSGALDRSGIQSLGIDGIAWGRGHRPLILGQLSSGMVEGFKQGQTDYQKGLRLPDLAWVESKHLSCTWRPTRTKVYLQVVMTRQKSLLIDIAQAAAGHSGGARATARAVGPSG
jgi:hypothetical protein